MKDKGEGNNKNNFRLTGVTLKNGYLSQIGPLEAEMRSILDTSGSRPWVCRLSLRAAPPSLCPSSPISWRADFLLSNANVFLILGGCPSPQTDLVAG